MSAAIAGGLEANKLYIGDGVVIKGATLECETVVVDGLLEGDVTVGNLIVRPTGIIKGRITVTKNAEIFGKIIDRLDVRGLLILRATSRVEGNVSCGLLTIEQGASITGGISSTLTGTQQLSSSERRQEIRSPERFTRREDLPAIDVGPLAAL
jgi:cytoskeletal protein CcmA (bactofilin family)